MPRRSQLLNQIATRKKKKEPSADDIPEILPFDACLSAGVQKIWFPGHQLGMNEIINGTKGSVWRYTRLKNDAKKMFSREMQAQKIKPMGKCYIFFVWLEARYGLRDLDNITAPRKIIQDAMIAVGIIKDDNPRIVVGFDDYWEKSAKKFGALVYLFDPDRHAQYIIQCSTFATGEMLKR